jgi:S-methylmethionine-dependent homocysteine/selenocysteine methylase
MGNDRPVAEGLLDELLRSGPIRVLDGATGTELERRGVPSALPLWSAHALLVAPEILLEIHRDYARAGADLLTANSFRTQRRTLAHAGLGACAAELTTLAVRLAREGAAAARGRRVHVAGSVAPLEDCFRPDLVPPAPELEREHAEHAENLARAGVDLALIETMNTTREAVAAWRAADRAGLPAIVCFTCDAAGRLLSGERLEQAVATLRELGARALGVNCLPPRAVGPCLPVLRAAGLPFAVQANLGAPTDATGRRRTDACTPGEYAAHAREWIRAGARLIGGCCGTTPAHIATLRTLVDAQVAHG